MIAPRGNENAAVAVAVAACGFEASVVYAQALVPRRGLSITRDETRLAVSIYNVEVREDIIKTQKV